MCLPQLHCRRPRRLSAITGNEADGLRSATTTQSTIVSAVKQPSGRQRPRAGQAHSVGGGRAGTGDLLRNSVSRGKERRKDGDDNWSIHFNHENATWAKDSARGVCRVKGIRFVDDPCGRCGRSLPPSLGLRRCCLHLHVFLKPGKAGKPRSGKRADRQARGLWSFSELN